MDEGWFGVYLTGDSFCRNSRSLGSSFPKGSSDLSVPKREDIQPIAANAIGAEFGCWRAWTTKSPPIRGLDCDSKN